MENVTPPYPANPELRQPHPGPPLPPARSGVPLPPAGIVWLLAGLGLGAVSYLVQFVAMRSGWGYGWSEWPLLIAQFLLFAGGVVGGAGAVAIGVRIALPHGR